MKKHIIFDLDGTLINSLPIMEKAWKVVTDTFNLNISFYEYKKYTGLPFDTIMNKLGLSSIGDEIKKVCDGVGADELTRARAQIKASILMALESSSSRCEQLARQMMVFGRPLPTEEVVANIESVDRDAILNTARRIFSSPLTVAALGPISKLESFEEIGRRLE